MNTHPDYKPQEKKVHPSQLPGWQPNVGPQEVSDRGVDLNVLFGKTGPKGSQARKFEQPWHRSAAYMTAACRTPKEIAAACDKDVGSVYALMRNEWFQTTVNEIQKELHLEDDVMALLRGEVQNSVLTLIEIRDDAKAPASARKASASEILDRVLGKAQQNITVDTTVRSADPVAEAERLEREVAALRRLDTNETESAKL